MFDGNNKAVIFSFSSETFIVNYLVIGDLSISMSVKLTTCFPNQCCKELTVLVKEKVW